MGPRVLVVEDDPAIAGQLVRGLGDDGFQVDVHPTGVGAAERLLTSPYDVLLLDLVLPGAHGFAILDALRGRTNVPVIVLTDVADLPTRLDAFARGAADFVPKPFFVAEVAARIRARLGVGEESPRRVVSWGEVRVDRDARRVYLGSKDAELTPHEYNVLDGLVARRGRAVSRETLRDTCLSPDGGGSDRTVDSHVMRVRRKLGPAGSAIRTVWGVGYRLDVPDGG